MKKLWHMFPWVWTALGAIYSIWYQIVPGKWILDSDLAAEMVLARHLNQTRRIISRDWFYSRELRVLESQWFYRIGLLFSPENWHTARVIAAILLFLVFIALILFAARGIGLGDYAPWMSAILMWPFGKWYLVYGLYGTFYLIYMIFSLAVIGILMRLSWMEAGGSPDKSRGIKCVILSVTGFLCSMGAGMNGVKQTMVFFAPLFLTAFAALLVADSREKAQTLRQLWQKCRRECIFAFNTVLFVIGNLAGYLINSKILSKNYDFVSYDGMVFLDEPQNRLYDIFLDFLKLFGYIEDVPVFSVMGIACALGIGFAAFVAISIVRLHKRLPELEYRESIIVLLLEISLLLDAAVYCFIGNYAPYYWLPLLPFAIAAVILELRTEKIALRYFRNVAFVAFALILPVLSYGTVQKEMERPLFSTKGFREVTDFLMENGYTEGYASFWNSAVLREMSNGEIQTWTLYSVSEYPYIYVYRWLQEREKTEQMPGERCFVIFNEERDGNLEDSVLVQYGSGELVYANAPLYVYEFADGEGIYRAVEEFLKTLE